MGTSSIEWTEKTWNPLVGCAKVSPGCAHCYAETMAKRLRGMALADLAAGRDPGRKRHYLEAVDERGRWTGKFVPVPEALADPLHWRKPGLVFVNSMSDLFADEVTDEFIDRVFATMYVAKRHTFQVLTKRARRMAEYFARRDRAGWVQTYARPLVAETTEQFADWLLENPIEWPLRNVWLGVSCEDQKRADERIPFLLKTPAAVRFVSAEPLLGPIDFERIASDPPARGIDALNGLEFDYVGQDTYGHEKLDWVIVGGESGPGSRACNVEWVRSIVEQCRAAAVPVFVKQLGANVVARNDEVSEWLDECAIALDDVETDGLVIQGDPVRVRLFDAKGGDPAKWPSDLRVRQWPKVAETMNAER